MDPLCPSHGSQHNIPLLTVQIHTPTTKTHSFCKKKKNSNSTYKQANPAVRWCTFSRLRPLIMAVGKTFATSRTAERICYTGCQVQSGEEQIEWFAGAGQEDRGQVTYLIRHKSTVRIVNYWREGPIVI